MGFLNYNIIFDIDISNYETDYTKIVEFHASKNILKMIKQRNQSHQVLFYYRIHIYTLWYVDFM
jgi:hypothetical protein